MYSALKTNDRNLLSENNQLPSEEKIVGSRENTQNTIRKSVETVFNCAKFSKQCFTHACISCYSMLVLGLSSHSLSYFISGSQTYLQWPTTRLLTWNESLTQNWWYKYGNILALCIILLEKHLWNNLNAFLLLQFATLYIRCMPAFSEKVNCSITQK